MLETFGFQMPVCKVVMQLHMMWITGSKANQCPSTNMKL